MKKIIGSALCLALLLTVFSGCKKNDTNAVDAMADAAKEKIIGEEGKVETISEGTLREVLNISQVSTVDYTYNSIVKKPSEKKEGEFGYAVSYNGTIKAGIDFSKISIEINSEDKHITVTLPDTEITDITIDAGSLEYIFMDEKLNTETVGNEAYSMACDDLKAKAADNPDIMESARENAESAVEALLKPWIEQIGEYDIEIK